MSPETFIKNLKEQILEYGLQGYKNTSTLPTNLIKDSYWIKYAKLHNELNYEQKEILMSIIRQIQIDTISHLLGVLDGSSYLSADRPDFVLKEKSSDEQINGDLQDLFLADE